MREITDSLSGSEYIGDKLTFMSSPDSDDYIAICDLADQIANDVKDGAGKAAAEDETVTEAEGTSAQGWRCRVCGYIYEGENLPDDYACPVCGAGPDQFEKL